MHRRRLQRHDVPGTARYLTFSCHRRLPLLNHPAIRDRFVAHLVRAAQETAVRIVAWVVMPEHVHLLVVPPEVEGVTTRFSHTLKRPFSIETLARWHALDAAILKKIEHGDAHRFWQTGGGYDRNVIGAELREKIRYIHANPIRRGLALRSTDWRWSSASTYERLDSIGPPIAIDQVPERSGPLT